MTADPGVYTDTDEDTFQTKPSLRYQTKPFTRYQTKPFTRYQTKPFTRSNDAANFRYKAHTQILVEDGTYFLVKTLLDNVLQCIMNVNTFF